MVGNWIRGNAVLSPSEFIERYEESEELQARLPSSPIASLRDLQHLYGALYTLATAGGSKYAAYLTPDQARDLVGEEESLIAIMVDLSGDEPRLGGHEQGRSGPVHVETYSEARISDVAHCKYASARGIDHSVTHRSGRNSSPEKLARYAAERLTRWATDEVVQEAAEDHEDGWIIEALADLGEEERAVERIEKAVEERLGGSRTALLTVRVKLEPDGEYQWPGEVEVFSAAMRARKLSKLVSKGEATDSAGEATDLISGDRTRTVGTAEDPLNYFLGKQTEKFPGLDADEAWRSHPVSEDAAATLMNAETFVDACTYHTMGADIYYLPYFMGEATEQRALRLYSLLHGAVEEATRDAGRDRTTPVEQAYQQRAPAEDSRLRFYVAAVMKHQSKRYDVFGDTMNGRLLYPSELSDAHANVLDSWVFDPAEIRYGLTPPMPTHENWSLLSGDRFVRPISTGWYFQQTFREGDDDTDAAADDFRLQALVAALAGDELPVEAVLETYVARLLEDSGEEFPSFRVASQFAQLSALAGAGLLDGSGPTEAITNEPDYQRMTDTDQRALADGGAAARATKLESFIETTPALDHDERRATFLLGALVGAVGSYQQWHEGRSTTLVDQFPVKAVSRKRIKKVTQDAIAKTLTYSREERRASTKFGWIVDPLREQILKSDPDGDWEINTDDLRFYYALGVTYGMNDFPEDSDATDDTTDTGETDD
jgi:CRISPR-associated protein Cas8b/Csh1 subtype I-B